MAAINPDMKAHHKDQLLAVLFHYMGQELRRKLMLECPQAYNDACGRSVVYVAYENNQPGERVAN